MFDRIQDLLHGNLDHFWYGKPGALPADDSSSTPTSALALAPPSPLRDLTATSIEAVPDEASHLETLAALSTKMKELTSIATGQPGNDQGTWHPDNDWSEIRKIGVTLEYLASRTDLASTAEIKEWGEQFQEILNYTDPNPPEGDNNLKNLQSVTNQLSYSTTRENQFRKLFYEFQVEDDRLESSHQEIRGYAEVLNTRNQLRFMNSILGNPVDDLDSLFAEDAEVPVLLIDSVNKHREAIAYHAADVIDWVGSTDESSKELLRVANQLKNQPGQDAFIWKGRAEVLTGRVQLIETHVVDEFETVFKLYQETVRQCADSAERELFPERFEVKPSGFFEHVQKIWKDFVTFVNTPIFEFADDVEVEVDEEALLDDETTETVDPRQVLLERYNWYKEELQMRQPTTTDGCNAWFGTYMEAKDSERFSPLDIRRLDQAIDSYRKGREEVLAGESKEHYFPPAAAPAERRTLLPFMFTGRL